jgi:hypothetical protein
MYRDVGKDSQLTQKILEINILSVFSVFKLELVLSSLNISIFGARQHLDAKNSFLQVEISTHSKIR